MADADEPGGYRGRHDGRGEDALDRMAAIVRALAGRRLRCRDHRDRAAGHGLPSGARA